MAKSYLAENTAIVKQGRAKVLRPAIMQSTRELLKKIVENSTPSAGIYYCVLNPDGWAPISYRFDEFPETDHSEFWTDYVAPIVAQRWSKVLRKPAQSIEAQIRELVHAFPRGRISRQSSAKYAVLHGNDTPNGISKETINRLFSLPPKVGWEFDYHEQCSVEDRNQIRSILKTKFNWPAVEPSFA